MKTLDGANARLENAIGVVSAALTAAQRCLVRWKWVRDTRGDSQIVSSVCAGRLPTVPWLWPSLKNAKRVRRRPRH